MPRKKKQKLWIAVKVERGLPVEVKPYRSKTSAIRRERLWRKQMNIDYDDTGVFAVEI